MVGTARRQTLQQRCPPEDRVERRAQLMREGREKLILHSTESLCCTACAALRLQQRFPLVGGLLLFGDIEVTADVDRERRLRPFEQRNRRGDHPSPHAIMTMQSVLDSEGLTRIEMRRVGLHAAVEVSGINTLRPTKADLPREVWPGKLQPGAGEP